MLNNLLFYELSPNLANPAPGSPSVRVVDGKHSPYRWHIEKLQVRVVYKLPMSAPGKPYLGSPAPDVLIQLLVPGYFPVHDKSYIHGHAVIVVGLAATCLCHPGPLLKELILLGKGAQTLGGGEVIPLLLCQRYYLQNLVGQEGVNRGKLFISYREASVR